MEKIHNLKYSFIFQRFKNYDSKSAFLEKFKVPYSTYYYMKKLSDSKILQRDIDINMITNSKDSDKTILKIVEDYISPPQHHITVQNIQKFIYDNTKISINRRKVKEILKNKLNYTYKKGSSGSSWL